MARLGMDVDVVEQVSRDLKRTAAELASIAAATSRLVEQATRAWEGHDARAFADEWRSSHQPAFVRVREAIEGLSRSAALNAREQRAVSGSSGSSGPAPSLPGAGPQPTQPSTPAFPSHEAPNAPADGHAGAALHFRDSIVGKHIDFDGSYGAQCVDVFQKYNHDVVGAPYIGGGDNAGAHGLYDHYASNGAAAHYDRVPASAGPPQPGDVAVWAANSPGSGGYGHVAVVTSVDGQNFQVVEQDGNHSETGVAFTSEKSAGDRYLLGYLRPKR